MLKSSELTLAPDQSLYHIRLTDKTLADNVILVGDPDRVNLFRRFFERVESESQHREIHALTGIRQGKRFTVLSTGMGSGCIDIVATELDAAANFDLPTRTLRPQHRTLHIVRIGTSGAIQPDIPCGSVVASRHAIGLDGLLNHYRHGEAGFLSDMQTAFLTHMHLSPNLATPYCVQGSERLLRQLADSMVHGITVTAPGFYGPQGREIRLVPAIENLNERLASYQYNGIPVTNLEMETAPIYGFANALGHEALSVSLIIANRPTGQFLSEFRQPMEQLIEHTLNQM